MNEIDLARAVEQIGRTSWPFLEYLANHMEDTEDAFLPTGRLAQSIVTRSEVELFGLSVPRFAIRLYLKNGGFVNCRRIAKLIEMFHLDNSQEWGDPYPEEDTAQILAGGGRIIRQPHIPIREILKGQSCIADSLLKEPHRLTGFDFRYLDVSAARLPEAYGEAESLDTEVIRKALPYTHTMDLGGGLCAQGVSFIVTAILAKHAGSINGIAEITALAHSPSSRTLTLGGLDAEKMARYFSTINLRLLEQCLTEEPWPELPEARKKDFASIIRCYLESGMPVLLPTSTRKLAAKPSASEGIYAKNALVISDPDQVPEDEHLVVIVGSSVSDDEYFVLHDTATLPFLVATKDEIAGVGLTRKLPKPVDDNGVIMAIVPKAVRMPLLDSRIYGSTSKPGRLRIKGLQYGLETFTRLYHSISDYPSAESVNDATDRFRLIRSDNARPDLDNCDPEYRVILECGLLRAMATLAEKRYWHNAHWLWLEIFSDSIWIWDAESSPLDLLPEERSDFILLAEKQLLVAVIKVEPNKRDAAAVIINPNR